MVGFPQHTDIHMRHYNFLIAPADTGKGESWKRATKYGLANYIIKTDLKLGDSGWYSSGENLVKKFVDNSYEDARSVTHFDEMRLLFEKGVTQNSTLNTRMLSLYDSAQISAGSLTHVGGTIAHTSVSITGGFTRDSFTKSLSGKGVSGDGFLSRCVLSYTDVAEKIGDWKDLDVEKINGLQQKMLDRFEEIKSTYTATNVWVPKETEGANKVRLEFNAWLDAEMKADAEFGLHFCGRLDAHFKRDILLRTIFSNKPMSITEETVRKSWEWAKHELELRRELWPADEPNPVSRMCVKIVQAFKKKEHATKLRVMDFCNVKRDGTFEEFNRSWKAMMLSGELVVIGKSHKRTDIFSLIEQVDEE